MPTPTSPEQDRKQQLSLDAAIDAISRGDISSRVLRALSDLSRDEAKLLATRWLAIDPDRRKLSISRAAQLTEDDILVSFGRLFRIALADPEPSVRQFALVGLWEDQGTDLLPIQSVLALGDPSPDVRAEAIHGLGRFVDEAVMGDLSDDQADRLQALLTRFASEPSEPPIIRRRALESLARFGPSPTTTELIAEAFDDEDSTIRAAAIHAMGRSLDRRWLSTVMAELNSDDAEMRFEAANAAGRFGDPNALEVLAELIHDDDNDVRVAAVDAISKIGGPGAVRILRSIEPDTVFDEETLEEALAEAELMAGNDTELA